jgi:Dyp-type peroxidase family
MTGAPGKYPLRNSAEIQGNILAPFNKPHQLFLFLNFANDQGAAQQWLASLIGDIATTQQVVNHNEQHRKLKKQYGLAQATEKSEAKIWMGVGLTSSGLVTLLPELGTDLVAYDAFWRGPLGEGADENGNRTAPAAVLGNREQSDPCRWAVGGPEQRPVDALVTLAADDRGELLERARNLVGDAEQRGLEVLEVQRDGAPTDWELGEVLRPRGKDSAGVEHFGFREGVSQPGIRGFTSEVLNDGRWESAERPGSPIIATGEFVLGYPGERGSYLRGRRPNPPAWMRDGSFQVFLRLNQDVAGWHTEMGRLGAELAEDLAAKVIGRQSDGTPLAKGGTGLNDFDYADDLLGNDTPRFAHIRRANLRDDDVYNDRSHRLLRRGIPFGPFAKNKQEAQEKDVERGLLLNAFMASIDDQFEVVQRHWASNSGLLPVTPGRGWPESAITDGPDPVIGASSHPCLLRRRGQDPVPLELPRFVRTTGAVYAFAPSISALGWLAGNAPTPPE